ncbi:PAS domain-containing hybrid sensor histidine kinase/response regulator [Anatilimnocola floriformis]|uniref:PAS domain-containing hybrid sensor histidine kinase/response regulator n=1 Tax=Anatilimnocola floriformis TaxID=2948575 RepID=UPI0020C240AD|nr:ATP-binding protein [Anatilimnocola floriformis]
MNPENGCLSLRELDQRFDLLATDAREYALILIGVDGRILCWNIGAEHFFGYQSPEIIGQHFSRFFTPDDVLTGQPESELHTALSVGTTVSNRWQLRKDGTKFWCHSTVTPLLDEYKRTRSFARVMHDLTESDATVSQRERADGLAAANRSKEEFMALLSHELRSPLSPIRNALSILRQMRTNDPLIEQAGNIIDRQVGVMVKLVDDLLDISRITKGKLGLTKEPVELRVVVNHAAESARTFIDARRHEFSVSLPTVPIWVDADPARMEQVIVNLLNNAAKYTNTGGLIHLSVVQEGEDAVIRVRDNGVGIAMEMLPHIFELFTQVDGSLGRAYGGLGIGLALARNLVEMHDGRLHAHSAGLGAGCEFTVKLPLLQNHKPPETKTGLELGHGMGKSFRVLVVEDNVDAADSLSLLLRLHGHEVDVARTGAAALEVAATSRHDVVLLDIGLPQMDGYQVAKRLRELPYYAEVMICALTGFTPSDADQQRQGATGFNHYYIKPLSVDTLLGLFTAMSPVK